MDQAPRKRSRTRPITIAAIVLGVLLGVPLVLFEVHRVPAGSMHPTIPIRAHVVGWRFNTGYEIGDVVVFNYPPEPSKLFLKRVVGVGGDTIAFENNQVIRNGSPIPRRQLDERCSYADEDEEGRKEQRSCVAFEEELGGKTYRVIQDTDSFPTPRKAVQVPQGHFYVIGDNRDNSHDSRFWGTVPEENLHGRVFWILK